VFDCYYSGISQAGHTATGRLRVNELGIYIMLFIQKSQLKAALTHAAKSDIRYYLNGVMLEFTASGPMHIVATDGHRLFCGLVDKPDWMNEPQKGPFSIIIPVETVKKACASKDGTLQLKAFGDGSYTLGDCLFRPVEGTFPDWRRVSPKSGEPALEGEHQYDWRYVADAQNALNLWYGTKDKYYWFKTVAAGTLGYGTGIMLGSDCTAYCVVMGVRTDKIDCASHFIPVPYENV
jgi:hypothetical protein